MYENLVYATPGPDRGADPQLLQGRELRRPGRAGRAHLQPARRACTIVRDANFGVAARLRRHALGHDLRRRLRGRRGPPVLHGRAAPRRPRAAVRLRRRREQGDGRRACGRSRPTPRPTCRSRSTRRTTSTAPRARSSSRTSRTTSPGINQYISEARTDPTKMPVEYAAIGKPLEDWQGDRRDRDRLAGRRHLRQGRRQRGRQRAVALEEAKDRFGGAAGEQAWRDFRRQDDPEAPTTVKSGNGSFDYPTPARHRRASRCPTQGSLVDPPEQRLEPARRRRAGGCSAASASIGGDVERAARVGRRSPSPGARSR